MKKLAILLLLIAATVFPAKPVVLEICRSTFCYQQMYDDVRRAVQMNDRDGNRYVRLFFADGTLVDVRDAVIMNRKGTRR